MPSGVVDELEPNEWNTPEYLPWMNDALCAETDPEAFFPEKGGSTRDAKKICTACEVKEQCLDFALERDERFGIWGGLSVRERRKLRRPRQSPAQKAAEAMAARLPKFQRLYDLGLMDTEIAIENGNLPPNGVGGYRRSKRREDPA